VTTRARTERSPALFFVVVFVLAVPFWILGTVLEPPEGVPLSLPWTALQFVCPLVAAVILVYREEGSGGVRELLQRTISRRGIKPIWYVPILLLAPFLLLLTYGIMRLLGSPLPEPQITLVAIPVLFALFFVSSACEEAGWMGYAVDALQERWGALSTGIIMGSIWALFHALPWVQVHGLEWAAWQAFGTVGLRILIVWLYNNTGGSVLSAVLFHAMVDLGEALFPNNGSHYDPEIFGLLTAITVALVTFLSGARTLARYRYGGNQAQRPPAYV